MKVEGSCTVRNSVSRVRLAGILIYIFALWVWQLFFAARIWAKPVGISQAQKVVKGWLALDSNPLGVRLVNRVSKVDSFAGGNGKPAYYVVSLEDSGFVIVPADDLVEPIIAFSEAGTYDPSDENPLGALVNRDLSGRIAAARSFRQWR